MLALLCVVIGGRLLDRDAPRNAALLLAPYLLAVPFAIAPLLNASGSGALKLALGWESAPLADGPLAVLFFYVTNLGLPFVLASGALFVRDLQARAFLGAWAVALFLIPNLMQVSDVAFDMNKYFQAMWIAVALLAAWLIRRWPWPAVAAGAAALGPVAAAGRRLDRASTAKQVLDRNELEAAELDRRQHAGAVRLRDRWLAQLADRSRRVACA